MVLIKLKMGQGRGSARVSLGLVVGVAMLCLLAQMQPTLAALYTVGGPSGWTFNVQNWPRGKPFKAGDILGKPSFFFIFLS